MCFYVSEMPRKLFHTCFYMSESPRSFPGPPGRPQEVPGGPPGRPRMQIIRVFPCQRSPRTPDHTCFYVPESPGGARGPVHTCFYVSEEPGARPRGSQMSAGRNEREPTKTNANERKTNVLAIFRGLHGGTWGVPLTELFPQPGAPRGRRIYVYMHIYIYIHKYIIIYIYIYLYI